MFISRPGQSSKIKGTLTFQDAADLYNWDGNAANELVNDSGGTVSYAGSSSSESATVGVAAVIMARSCGEGDVVVWWWDGVGC